MTARSKRGAAVAVSIAVHLALLAVLVLSTPILRLPTARFAPDIALELSPPPLMQPVLQTLAAASAPQPASPSATRPQAAASTASAAPAPPKPLPAPSPLAAAPMPSTPSPSQAGPAVGAATPPTAGAGHDWRVRPESGDDRGAVRAAIGCSHTDFLRLTTDEQSNCLRKLGDLRGAKLPHYDAVSPEKRAYYDAVVAAYAKMHAGTPTLYPVIGDGAGTTERWAGPKGAHMPGFGCKIPLGIPRGWKPKKGGPPNSVKLGPLPCYITPPSGFLTEEADLPDPTTLGPKR